MNPGATNLIPSVRPSRARSAGLAGALLAASMLALGACSASTPSASGTASSTTAAPTTTAGAGGPTSTAAGADPAGAGGVAAGGGATGSGAAGVPAGRKPCKVNGALTGAETATLTDATGSSMALPGGVNAEYTVTSGDLNVTVYTGTPTAPGSILVVGKDHYSSGSKFNDPEMKIDASGGSVEGDVMNYGLDKKAHVTLAFVCT